MYQKLTQINLSSKPASSRGRTSLTAIDFHEAAWMGPSSV